MEKLNLCKEVLENAIGVHKTCEQCGIELKPLEMVAVQAMEELLAYRTAEEQGLLLRLPCKIGDDIYVIPSEVNYRLNKSFGAKGLNVVCRQVVDHIEFNSYGYLVSTNEGMTVHRQEAFGETWFITREEAEKALEDMKSN